MLKCFDVCRVDLVISLGSDCNLDATDDDNSTAVAGP